MSRKHRLFIAVGVSSGIAARASVIGCRLREAGVDASWVPAEHLHVTLAFLGDDVDDADLHRICVIMDRTAADTPAFTIGFGGVSVFPDTRRPRGVWLSVSEGSEGVVRLHDALEKRLATLGFPPEPGGYRPHLTLGRFRGRSRPTAAPAMALQPGETIEACRMRVTMIALYDSRLSKAGPEHDLLHASPLA